MKSKKNSKNKLIKNYVRDFNINTSDLENIIYYMSNSGGFESRNFVNGINILKKMQNEKNCTKFLSFVGSIISTGSRGLIKDMIRKKMFDCIITTCGALDHDIAKSFKKYYSGTFDVNDSELNKKNIHRLGNIFIPSENYGQIIEEKTQNFFDEFNKICNKEFSGTELIKFIGSKLNESSFLYWAYKNDIPVIVPGIVDGAFGNQMWLFNQQHKDFKIDIMKDQTLLSDLIFEANKTGAFMLGGGISKHHTLWWNQFRGGLDYAVYITTANEWDGSLSGAEVKEAISWNKVKEKAKQITIHGEITTLLPIMFSLINKK
ncbi:MAG: deoxyhypusine synthase [Nitrososphaeraceae archaeon]